MPARTRTNAARPKVKGSKEEQNGSEPSARGVANEEKKTRNPWVLCNVCCNMMMDPRVSRIQRKGNRKTFVYPPRLCVCGAVALVVLSCCVLCVVSFRPPTYRVGQVGLHSFLPSNAWLMCCFPWYAMLCSLESKVEKEKGMNRLVQRKIDDPPALLIATNRARRVS